MWDYERLCENMLIPVLQWPNPEPEQGAISRPWQAISLWRCIPRLDPRPVWSSSTVPHHSTLQEKETSFPVRDHQYIYKMMFIVITIMMVINYHCLLLCAMIVTNIVIWVITIIMLRSLEVAIWSCKVHIHTHTRTHANAHMCVYDMIYNVWL